MSPCEPNPKSNGSKAIRLLRLILHRAGVGGENADIPAASIAHSVRRHTLQKFLLRFFRNRDLLRASRPTKGALRGRHGRRVRDAVGVSGRSMNVMRTNDSDATMKSRGSGITELMPSLRCCWRFFANDGGLFVGFW